MLGIGFVKTWREIRATWTAVHRPAANTKATATQAAPGVGKRNICTGITAVLAGGASAPAAVNVAVRVLDNATEIWGATLSLPATAGATSGVVRDSCWIPGTENQTMTIEFTAAAGANTVESVSMEGTTEPVS